VDNVAYYCGVTDVPIARSSRTVSLRYQGGTEGGRDGGREGGRMVTLVYSSHKAGQRLSVHEVNWGMISTVSSPVPASREGGREGGRKE
jgi:hypothetical protein